MRAKFPAHVRGTIRNQRLRVKLWLAGACVVLGCGGCGDRDGKSSAKGSPKAKPHAGPKVDPSPPVKAVAPDCFANEGWSAPICAGDGQAVPPWWGPQRWAEFSLRQQKTVEDPGGQPHWTLTFGLPAQWAEAQACEAAVKSKLEGGFSTFETLPSPSKDRRTFRASSERYVVTVACGTNIRGEATAFVGLKPAT